MQKVDKISSNRNMMLTGIHASNFCDVVKRFSEFPCTKEPEGHITKLRSFIAINKLPNKQPVFDHIDQVCII